MRWAVVAAVMAAATACGAPAAPPTATAVPAKPTATVVAAPTVATAPPATPTSGGPAPAPAPTRPPAGAAPPTRSSDTPASVATAPAPAKPTAGATAVPTRGAQVAGSPTAGASGPRGTPVRLGSAVAQRVFAAPGAISYALGTDGIYRLEGGAATLIAGTPSGVDLVALGEGKMVAGRGASCMADFPTAPLRYSRDGGRTWADANGPTGRGFPATPHVGRGDEVFARYCSGVLWSTDAGRTFAAVPSLSPANFEPRDLAVSPDGATAYVSANSEGGTLQVYRSTRAGAVWGPAAKIHEGWALGALAVAPDGKLYLGTVNGVRVSTDRGATWQELPTAGLEEELLQGDPAKGNLTAADERKMQGGVGINDLALVGEGVVAATQHGLYRFSSGRWARWSDVSGRVERVVFDDGAVYAMTAGGVVRLPA